jgi:hypothetical protein
VFMFCNCCYLIFDIAGKPHIGGRGENLFGEGGCGALGGV